MDLNFILQLVDLPALSLKYPMLTKVFIVMGVFRVVLKPILALAIKYVDIQPSLEKNEKVMRLLRSPAWKTVSFALDYLFSLKLPFAPGSVGFKVQQAVQADKGVDPTPEPPKPAAGL